MMKISDFIRIQNKELVERGLITFKLLLPLEYGGKWFFYCEEGKTVEDLCKFLKENDIDVIIEWPWNSVEVENNGYTDNNEPIYKYVFDLNDYYSKTEAKNFFGED